MKIYIIRHGETDWNKEKKLQGQSETDLNEYGRELARITGNAIKDIHFDHAFSSPLKRARETADIILAGRNITVTEDERLKEICFGIYEGVPKEMMPPEFEYFFNAPEKYAAPKNGESYEMLKNRTGSFIETVLKPLSLKEPDSSVVIFGHGAMNRSLMINLQGLGVKDMWSGPFQENCCVNLFEMHGNDVKLIWEARKFY